YVLKYEKGPIPGVGINFYWNEEFILEEAFLIWDVGKTITGSFEIPKSKIRATNSLTLKITQAPFGNNVVSFDSPITLGYSEEPEQPPEGETWWDIFLEWVEKNKYWAALGVTGLAVLYMMMKTAKPIIVIPRGKKGG
ncbi:unnamed protein product, partial [marine sediment metagenome]